MSASNLDQLHIRNWLSKEFGPQALQHFDELRMQANNAKANLQELAQLAINKAFPSDTAELLELNEALVETRVHLDYLQDGPIFPRSCSR